MLYMVRVVRHPHRESDNISETLSMIYRRIRAHFEHCMKNDCNIINYSRIELAVFLIVALPIKYNSLPSLISGIKLIIQVSD